MTYRVHSPDIWHSHFTLAWTKCLTWPGSWPGTCVAPRSLTGLFAFATPSLLASRISFACRTAASNLWCQPPAFRFPHLSQARSSNPLLAGIQDIMCHCEHSHAKIRTAHDQAQLASRVQAQYISSNRQYVEHCPERQAKRSEAKRSGCNVINK